MAEDTATATPEVTSEVTPEVTPDVTPEPTPEKPKEPLTRSEVRAEMFKENAEKKAAAEKAAAEKEEAEKEGETLTTEVTPEGEKTAQEEESKGTTAEGEKPEGETEKPDGESVTPEPIRVEIPEDHPLRTDQGASFLTAASPQEERQIRALLNATFTRRKDVDAKDTVIAERDALIAEYEQKDARREAHSTATQKWQGTPEYKASIERYNEIKETVGEEAATQYWKGVEAGFTELAQKEYDERMKVIETRNAEKQTQAAEAAGMAWAEEAYSRASVRVPEYIRNLPNYNAWFNEAIHSFDSELQLDHYPHLKDGDLEGAHQEFYRFLGARLAREQAVTKALRANTAAKEQEGKTAATKAAEQERQRQKDRADAVTEHKQEAAKKRKETPLHPLGNLSSVDRVSPLESTDGGEPEAADLSPHELRRQMRQGAVETGRRLTSRR